MGSVKGEEGKVIKVIDDISQVFETPLRAHSRTHRIIKPYTASSITYQTATRQSASP